MNLLTIFIIASILNVILQTIKSIVTIKCGKWVSALVNAVVYGFYTWVVVLTVCDLSLWTKIIITAITNFIGVWLVKWAEERTKKDRLWKIELAIPYSVAATAKESLKDYNIPHNSMFIDSWCVFNCYCMTQEDTEHAVNVAKMLGGKYSAYESKMGN